MDLGLKKLPWWGQLALYVVLGAGLIGAHHYFYAVDMQAAVAKTHVERRTIETGIARARVEERRLPEFRSRVAELNARLTALRNVLPEQKDVGDLLRRIQTLATQSSLTIRGFKPQAVAQRQQHAEWPISAEPRGHVPRPRRLLRQGQPDAAHHQHLRHPDQAARRHRARIGDRRRAVHRHHVRPDGGASGARSWPASACRRRASSRGRPLR